MAVSLPQGLFLPPRTSTLFVAAANATALERAQADRICDGVNDHIEIQEMLDALPATGGSVCLSSGTFNIEVSLVLDSYQTLRGCGRNTILTTTTADLDIIIATGGAGTEKVGIVIADLCIDGNAGGVANDMGIIWTYVDNSKIINTWILDCPEDAIKLITSDKNIIANNILAGCGWGGIWMLESTYNLFRGNIMYGNSGENVYMTVSAHYNSIIGNTCNGGTSGLYIRDSNQNDVVGNILIGTDKAIYVRDSDNNSIIGNDIHGNVHGIYLISASLNNTIAGNSCIGNTGIAIQLSGCSYNAISGNTCNGNSLDAIWVTNSSLYNVVSSNVCEGNSYGIEIDASSNNNTITGNNCRHNTNPGIVVNCDYCSVIGNICCENEDDGMDVIGTGHIIQGNMCNQNNYHGIFINAAFHCIINDNSCSANSQFATNTRDDILVESSDYNNIQDNNCRAGALANKPNYGIDISNATCDKNVIDGNDLYDDGFGTAPFNDAGTLTTVKSSNRGIQITDVKDYIYIKNTSGGASAIGDVARHKAVAAGNEYDTPTANGEDSVLGMVAEVINNNASGLVQVGGKTTVLKATNAGGNIVIGDYLCTEAGVRARLAAAGDMTFARALEACAAANCTIDALIMSPMKI